MMTMQNINNIAKHNKLNAPKNKREADRSPYH